MDFNKKILTRYIYADILASLIVWFVFIVFRKVLNDIELVYFLGVLLPSRYYLYSMVFFPAYCLFINMLAGFYLNLSKKTKIDIFLSTLVTSFIIATSLFFGLRINDVVISSEYFYYSLLVLFVLLFLVNYVLRALSYNNIQINFKTKKWTSNTLIIGDDTNTQKIINDIEKYGTQYNLIGYVSIFQKKQTTDKLYLGAMYDIERIINDHNIKEIIVALDEKSNEQDLLKIINQLYSFSVEIQFTPRLYEILTGSARIGTMGINPLVSITKLNMPDWQISVKRVFDVVVSLISLIFLSPLFLYFSIRIKRDSKGPIFFKQDRIGRYGKPFNMIKFRTMYTNSENGKPKLSSAFDERITPFGRVLRKYRFDELPQFWNVLKGDMSLVGPRPERKFFIDQIVKDAPYYCLLYKIRPGLTSWGPIKIGYADTVEKMIERLNYDIIYIENMSLFNDLKIILLTVEILFKGKGM
ncbi:undecaprenyl-phosphate glucose phosphotransferase [Paludibacter sp.]